MLCEKNNMKKYSAYHTASIIIIAILLNFVDIGNRSYSIEDFESIIGKILFTSLVVFIISPVFINTFSMLGNILSKGKWGWFIATLFFAFGATALYYFVVYEKEKNT